MMAQSNSNSLYKYSQIAADHFRLIELKSLTPVLDIGLADYSDHSSTTYHAVSYAWGLESNTGGILCNGRQFKITPHLVAGLQIIFQHHRDTRLWVDSICIDQGSGQEKAEQVAKMHHIYRKAEGVYVWLGKEEDRSDEIMNSIKNVHVPDQSLRGDDDETLVRLLNIKFESPKLFEASDFKAIAALGRRSWFKRLWVFQECYFARSLTFFCGGMQVEGDQFLKVLNNLTINSFGPVEPPGINEEDDLFGGFTALKEVMKIKADQDSYRKARTFFDYVVLGRNRLAKEPVDHIYAVFGITEEWDNVYQRHLKVDYSQEAREKYWQLYTAYGKVAMVEESNLRLLSIVDSIQRPNELPSWCPNLHSRMSLTSLGEDCSYAAGWPWAGHGKTSSSPNGCRRHSNFLGQEHNHASVSLSSDMISVWGASIGHIAEIGMPRNWDLDMYSDDLVKVKPLAEALLVWFSASEEFCKSHYHGPSNSLGVWHRVLVGGGNRSRRPPRIDLEITSEAYQSTETEPSGVGDDMVARDQGN